MKNTVNKNRSLAPWLLVMAAACALQARAATYTNNFNLDPSAEASLVGAAKWVESGGVAGSGYVSLTDAVGSQQGTLVLPDFTAGEVVGGFVADFMIRIGGGTARPADGMAFSFGPEINESSNFGEEGLGTGLVVSFDTYDNNGADTAPAIDVKVGGTADANIVSTTFLEGQREGNRARPGPIFTDPSTGQPVSLQTGDEFVPVRIEVRNGLLNVFYKGLHLVRDVVTPFAPVPGRFALGGRTGGATDNQWIDNLRIETFPTTAPSVTQFTATPGGFRVQLQDAPNAALDPATVNVLLNGAALQTTPSKTGNLTSISFVSPTPFEAGSSNAIQIIYGYGSPATLTTNQLLFIVGPYATLPASFARPAGSIDLNASGFSVFVHQARADSALPNTTARAENQLRGFLIDPNTNEPYVNHAAPGAGGTPNFLDADVINWNQDAGGAGGEAGNFQAPAHPDEPIPGIPGDESSTDNIAAEIIAFLDLAAGVHRLGVNSDDGFRVTSAPNPRDLLALELGEFDGGRGAADTLFDVRVDAAGIYPIRLVWYEGGGGANLEFFSVDLATGAKVLINDRQTPGAIRAYSTSAAPLPPYVIRVTPAADAAGVFPDVAFEATVAGLGATPAVLTLNGAAVTPTATTQGTNTVLRFQPAELLAAGSTNRFQLSFDGVTNTIPFVVQNYITLPAGLALPADACDTNALGFRVRVAQARSDAGLENTSARAEAQLAGTLIDPVTSAPFVNEAASGAGPNGAFTGINVINWNQDAEGVGAEVGNFQGPASPDAPIPGIPGSGGHTDNLAAEIFAYLELPAGVTRLGVNSDDGFRLTAGADASATAPVLGVFEGGRGAADTTFAIVAPVAGLYPFRLIWYEGGGGANIEFFSLNASGQRTLINAASPDAIAACYNTTASAGPRIDNIALTGGNVVITWTGAAVLESANSVAGPWTPVPNAASPYTAAPSGEMRFFRLRE